VDDLEEMLVQIRAILSAEVRGAEISPSTLLGCHEDELRRISHHPGEELGCSHLLPSHGMGRALVALNLLRVHARETELCAAHAVPGKERCDLIRALNRLSSAFYVLMCREQSGFYERKG